MAKIDVLNIKGEKTGKSVELPESLFGVEPNEHAIYLAVKRYLANQRQGTHKSKEKGEISFSTRKIKKQKGTGTARAGSLKNPLFRKGGRVFGPRPRDYNVGVNKKVQRLAKFSALSTKLAAESIVILEDFTFKGPKTKEMIDVIASLSLTGKKALIVTSDYDKNVYLSCRNIQGSIVRAAKDLNTYEIMNANTIVFCEKAIDTLKDVYKA